MSYNGSCVLGLGWTFIVLGSLSVIFGIAADAAFIRDGYFTMHQVSAPIWSGVLVIVTGVIGVFSGKNPTSKGWMAAFLPLSICVIIACLVCWAVAASGISVDGISCNYSWWGIYSYTATSRCSAMQALHGVNILLGFTEMVLGFVTSILCCVGMCSSNDVQPGTVIYHHAAPMQAPGGVVIMHNTAGGYPMHTAGVTYVGGPQPVVMQPVHPVAPPAYTYASGPINPAVVVNTQSTI
ncbi:hypothetical protein Bbelb_196780 [Branchiostoma belcheri]|nr:hypothetical protein Bbelb_196780 [Branchiostoma belcheri]